MLPQFPLHCVESIRLIIILFDCSTNLGTTGLDWIGLAEMFQQQQEEDKNMTTNNTNSRIVHAEAEGTSYVCHIV